MAWDAVFQELWYSKMMVLFLHISATAWSYKAKKNILLKSSQGLLDALFRLKRISRSSELGVSHLLGFPK